VVPPIFEPQLAHRRVGVATEPAQDMARRLAREKGLLVGVSARAALVGALRVAEETGGGTPSWSSSPTAGRRYLSHRFWDDEG
jgi:cysteine synthase